jgi:ABC-2 type transport system ATP-binding protein
VISGGEVGMYPWLTALETLEYIGFLYRLPRKLVKARAKELLQVVNLDPAAWKRPTMQLSKGMKQRVMIARGLMNDPDLIFLDEPTIGLDVQAVQDTRALISSWAAQGKTVILTSHNMGDIEQTCDRLCIIQNGKISVEKSLDELKGRYKTTATLEIAGQWHSLEAAMSNIGSCYHIQQCEQSVRFTIALPEEKLGLLYGYFSNHAERLLSISVDKESLEDLYLSLLSGDVA